MIDKFTVSLDRTRKPKKMGELADFTSQIVKERFDFLNENSKELEENEVFSSDPFSPNLSSRSSNIKVWRL